MLEKHAREIARTSQILGQIYQRVRYDPIPPQDFLHPRRMKFLLSAQRYSQCSYKGLRTLYTIASLLERRKVSGSFVECGVRNGGSAAVIATPASRNPSRHVWLFDSWEGLPAPTEFDVSYKGVRGEKGMARGQLETAQDLLFGRLGLDSSRVHLVKGWFDHTILPVRSEIGSIALLHLDCDWHESVKFCLEELYQDVVEGGFVILDDYGYWQGCKKAVDEFLERERLAVKMTHADWTAVFFQKPPQSMAHKKSQALR